MTHEQAQAELNRILANQKTVSVSKLNKLFQVMNMSRTIPAHEQEVRYLKGEIKKLAAQLREEREKRETPK